MKFKIILITLLFTSTCTSKVKPAVVFQSDFGLANHSIASMYGVANEVDPTLRLYNLNHNIPSYNIWLGSLSLSSTMEYWPKGTVFVSVVDPGVGTERTSVVAKTKTGHYIVTPDNGTLTFVEDKFGIEELREIEEAVNRRADSQNSYTFHGRDVYAYTAARLASGVISFEEVGPKLDRKPIMLPYIKAQKIVDNTFEGTIDIIDEPYGNLWSNIDRELFLSDGIQIGDMIKVSIWNGNNKVYEDTLPYVETFGAVAENKGLVFINSVYQVSVALNMGNFARTYNIEYGWKIEVKRVATLLN